MKAALITATVAALFVSNISAKCVCDPNDTHCLNRCVVDTNDCVSECKSNNECYARCIEYHWPGLDSTMSYSTPSYTWPNAAIATPTTSLAAISPPTTSTTSYWHNPSPSSMWSQTASLTSAATWSPSSSIEASTTPSISISSSIKVSQAVVGMGLAVAAYFMV